MDETVPPEERLKTHAGMRARKQYMHYLRCVSTRASPRKDFRVLTQIGSRRRHSFVAWVENRHRRRVRKRARRIQEFMPTRRFARQSSALLRPLPFSGSAVPLVTTQKKPRNIFFRWR